jgi:hypothetical protein
MQKIIQIPMLAGVMFLSTVLFHLSLGGVQDIIT